MFKNEPVLRQKPFLLFLLSRASTALAYQMFTVAVGWQIYSITNSPLYLGLVGLAQFLPMFLLTLVVGHAADRYDRKMIIRICQIIDGIGIAVLAAGSFSGILTKESILIIVFLIGAARSFESPALQSLMPGLVSAELFPRAAAWSASAFQTAIIIGPAAGGLLYALGPGVVYSISALLFFLSGILIAVIKTINRNTNREPVTFKSLFAGISYIKSKPVILGAISFDLFAVLLGGATALLPAYAKDILFVGPFGLGILRSAPAIGALAISLYLAKKPLKQSVGRIMYITVAVFGLATIVFAVSKSFALSFAALLMLGGSDVISVVIRSSLVQLQTPDNMRGRVNAVNMMFIGTSNQLGEFESGITAALFGIVPAVVIGGAGTIIVVVLWIFLFPALYKADTIK